MVVLNKKCKRHFEDVISIIIPVWNVEKFIANCLDSVLAQSYKNFEIICINDGATDSSADILSKYAEIREK